METTTESKRSDSGSSCELHLTEDVDSASELKEVYPEDISYDSPDYSGDEAEDYRKYYKQASESEGFDVDSFPGLPVCGGVVPTMLTDSRRLELSGFCKQALLAFNTEENANYEFVELIKANSQVVCGIMFYLTFEARTPSDETCLTFQAKVWRKILNQGTKVILCRIKPAK